MGLNYKKIRRTILIIKHNSNIRDLGVYILSFI